MNKLRIVQLKKDTPCSLCARELRTGWTVVADEKNKVYCLGSCSLLVGMGVDVTPLPKLESGEMPF